MERSTTHGEINSRIHTTATATDESPIQRPKSPKSQTHINTTHRPGMKSDLAPWTETARGASRACSASASPPSGSPARRTPDKKNTELRSDQQAAESNQIQTNREPLAPNRTREITPTPTPKANNPSYPLLLGVARGGRRCGRCGVAVPHHAFVVSGGGGLLRGCRPGRARRRACVRGERGDGGAGGARKP